MISGQEVFFFSGSLGGQHIFFPPKCSAGNFFSLLISLQRVVQGGLSHGSRTEKTTNHGSRISKFHFPESRK